MNTSAVTADSHVQSTDAAAVLKMEGHTGEAAAGVITLSYLLAAGLSFMFRLFL